MSRTWNAKKRKNTYELPQKNAYELPLPVSSTVSFFLNKMLNLIQKKISFCTLLATFSMAFSEMEKKNRNRKQLKVHRDGSNLDSSNPCLICTSKALAWFLCNDRTLFLTALLMNLMLTSCEDRASPCFQAFLSLHTV